MTAYYKYILLPSLLLITAGCLQLTQNNNTNTGNTNTKEDFSACETDTDCRFVTTIDSRYDPTIQDAALHCINRSGVPKNRKILREQQEPCVCKEKKCQIQETVDDATDNGARTNSVQLGVWGGRGIEMTITDSDARITYDCGSGRIAEPLRPGRGGNFTAQGIHILGKGGPARIDDPPLPQHPATYRGIIKNDQMDLTVTLPESGTDYGTFTLVHGQRAALNLCL